MGGGVSLLVVSIMLILFAGIMILSSASTLANRQGDVGTVFAVGGSCGDNVTWDLTNGVLTISGSGFMHDYVAADDVEWCGYRENITKVVIGDGVETIGSYAFAMCTSLEEVVIMGQIKRIGIGAFGGCESLVNLDLSRVNTIISGNPSYAAAYAAWWGDEGPNFRIVTFIENDDRIGLLNFMIDAGWDPNEAESYRDFMFEVKDILLSNKSDEQKTTEICEAILNDNDLNYQFAEEILEQSRGYISTLRSIDYMFVGCSSLTILDLSGFDLSEVFNAEAFLEGCDSLTTIYMPCAMPEDDSVEILLPNSFYGIDANNEQQVVNEASDNMADFAPSNSTNKRMITTEMQGSIEDYEEPYTPSGATGTGVVEDVILPTAIILTLTVTLLFVVTKKKRATK